MTNYYKEVFTTSVCNSPKGFKDGEAKSLNTYTKLEDGKLVPTYTNTFDMFLSNTNYAQIGVGTTHMRRGAYVVDSDTEIKPETLYYIYKTYFVEPSVILYNPTSKHTQTFFFFDKDIGVYSYNKEDGTRKATKKQAAYMDNLHRLNSFMGIGDMKFTGYWAKNPYNSCYKKYFDTRKTYSFKTLNFLINELDLTKDYKKVVGKEITWKENCDNYCSKLASMALNETEEDYTVEKSYTITDEEFSETEEVLTSEELEEKIETEMKAQKAFEERRGKFAKNSENRHSTLFQIMKNKVIEMGKVDKELLINLCKEENKKFNIPLTEEEVLQEVCNETTLTKTFGTLVHWAEYKEYLKEKEMELVTELMFCNNNDIEVVRKELVEKYKWSNYLVAKNTNGNIDEAKALDQKKYDRSKYDSVKTNYITCKCRNWLKANNWSTDFPKKWNEEERAVANEMIRNKL